MSQIAKEIPVELRADKVLKILWLEGNCYITDFEGLKLIEAPPKWLVDISPRTLRTLKEFGFTGEVTSIIYKKNRVLQETSQKVFRMDRHLELL